MNKSDLLAGKNLLKPKVKPFFEAVTNTFSYVVQDPNSNTCAIIDSVMNFDPASGHVGHESADEIVRYVEEKKLSVEWIIETHVHADHLTAAPYIKDILGGKIAIGEHVITVQETFAKIFNYKSEFTSDGTQFDHLFKNEEMYQIGGLTGITLHTPGHTPACMTHVIGDAAFVGDTIFMPDAGTARADFPGGDSAQLFHSARKILRLPPRTRVFMCHDYGTQDREEYEYKTTVKEELENNIHVNERIKESEFVAMRDTRDKTLDMPRLILPSLQVNMRAGHFPEPEDNDVIYLKLPVDMLR